MNERDAWKKVEKVLKALQICLTVIVAFWPIALKGPLPTTHFQWLTHAAQSNYAGLVVPVTMILIAIIESIKRLYVPSNSMDVIHSMLTDLQKELFQGREPTTNRITLFRHRQWAFKLRRPWTSWPPWHGWLVPIERSGSFTRKTPCIFRASKDDPRPNGVAGHAYYNPVLVVNTPNLPNIEPTVDPMYRPPWYAYPLRFFRPFQYWRKLTPQELEACRLYAKETWVEFDWVVKQKRLQKTLPRSLCGVCIQVNGEPWGAIVIDSREPDPVTIEKVQNTVGAAAGFLQKLLKGLK